MSSQLRSSPRFSLNKLAEYMLASPRRRRRLIIDQIKPIAAVVITYDHAKRALIKFFSDPSRSAKSLLTAAAQMRDRAAVSPDEFARRSLMASARALEAFAPLSEKIKPKGVVALALPIRNTDVLICGVRVVVAPDVSLLEIGTEHRIGAIKFHFPRSSKLTTEALQYVSTLLYQYLEDVGDSPRKSHCFSIDVFSEKFETVPRAMKDRYKNLEAACEEIAERWPVLYDSLLTQAAATEGDN